MRRLRKLNAGFSLVEMVAATAIMATLSAASFMLVRTSHDAWLKHRDDAEQRQAAFAALQQIMRKVRQAPRVTAISAAANTAGNLTLLMPDGTTAMWSRNAGTNQLLYGTTSASNLLAPGITEATFVAYLADGTTATTQLDVIHAVRCTLKYTLARPGAATTETISCTAFLRSW